MNNYKTLFQRLKNHSENNFTSMHMPGHKRRPLGTEFLQPLGCAYDITEIEGFDDLHHPRGILAEAMDRAAKLWGSRRCFFLVNGSTGGILSAVRAAALATGSKTLIMARNCHRSVYNAAELLDLKPVYLLPETPADCGFCGDISPEAVRLSLQDSPGAPVILTSPTYEGVISNIPEIAEICHRHGSPLIVDEAHGAHLGLSGVFPQGAVAGGADAVIQSLHKTMTGLNQTALLHISGDIIPAGEIARQLAVFQTSSPSYPLMASIDGTVDLMENRGEELLGSWKLALETFDRAAAKLEKLSVPGHSRPFACEIGKTSVGSQDFLQNTGIYDYDPSKIVVSCCNVDISGSELMAALYKRWGIVCEMAAGDYLVAMTGPGNTREDLLRLAEALLSLDRELTLCKKPPLSAAAPLPPKHMNPQKALSSACEHLSLDRARGRIAAEYVWAYPPGIPLVVPGEELTEDLLVFFRRQMDSGVALRCNSGSLSETICVLK